MSHHSDNHGSPTITIVAAALGTVLKLIEGGVMLEVLQYLSYGVAICVGVLTIIEKNPFKKKPK